MVEFCSCTPLTKLSKKSKYSPKLCEARHLGFLEQVGAQNEADGDVVTQVQESDDGVLAMNAAGKL
jgi:hypothetical protein